MEQSFSPVTSLVRGLQWPSVKEQIEDGYFVEALDKVSYLERMTGFDFSEIRDQIRTAWDGWNAAGRVVQEDTSYIEPEYLFGEDA